MAPIGSVTSSTTTVLPGVETTTEIAPSVGTGSSQSAPVFEQTLTTQGRIFALGLGAPKNNGDIEALFAEIATKFGAETETANDFAEAAEDATRSTALRAAVGNLALLASLGAAIKEASDSIAESKREIAELNEQIDAKETEKAAAQAQYDIYRDEYTANTERQFDITGEVIELGAEWIVASPERQDEIEAEISALDSERNDLFWRNYELDGLMIDLEGQIIDLTFEIVGLEAEKGIEELSILFNQGQINTANALLDAYAVLFMPFSVDLALRTMGEIGRASFEVTPDQSAVDKAVKDATDNITEQLQRMGDIDAFKKTIAQMPANDPATLSAIQDFLAGKPLPEGASPEQNNQLTAAANLLTLLQQLFQGGVGGKSTPSDGNGGPLDQLQATLNENLPEEPESQQKVATEAAGLASGLALLRSILGQVANGEQSQGPQVPGPSGRLTLAI